MAKVYLLPDGHKRCSICKRWRGRAHFSSDRSTKDGRNVRCRECESARWRAYYESDPEPFKARSRAKARRWRLGVSVEDYARMLAEHDGQCAICGKRTADDAGKATLAVDHDHTTGCVRGLLCHKCNMALGLFEDDAERVRRAAAYLADYAAAQSPKKEDTA